MKEERYVRPFLTPEDLAEILGVSIHTIYAKTSRRNRGNSGLDLPPWIKVGKLIRFPVEDYWEWLQKKKRHHAQEA